MRNPTNFSTWSILNWLPISSSIRCGTSVSAATTVKFETERPSQIPCRRRYTTRGEQASAGKSSGRRDLHRQVCFPSKFRAVTARNATDAKEKQRAKHTNWTTQVMRHKRIKDIRMPSPDLYKINTIPTLTLLLAKQKSINLFFKRKSINKC